MKKKLIILSATIVIIAQTVASYAGQLSSDVEQYVGEVQQLAKSTTNTVVQNFIGSCLSGAAQLKGLEAHDSRTYAAFDTIVTNRREWIAVLTKADRSDPVVPLETESYNKHLYPYRETQYVSLVRLQDQLFERKYFESETSKNANIIEGAINSHWSLTRADRSDTLKVLNKPTLGVSPWEAILRFEPALTFEGGGQPALLGTMGADRVTSSHFTNR